MCSKHRIAFTKAFRDKENVQAKEVRQEVGEIFTALEPAHWNTVSLDKPVQ